MTVINHITEEHLADFSLSPELNRYQRIATHSAIYPGQNTPLGLAYVALKMNGEAGEFAEHVGKAMRDDNLILSSVAFSDAMPGVNPAQIPVSKFGKLTPKRRELLIKEIGDVLWYLSAACNELDTTLSQVALTNLWKLKDRTDRNALRGSGDER